MTSLRPDTQQHLAACGYGQKIEFNTDGERKSVDDFYAECQRYVYARLDAAKASQLRLISAQNFSALPLRL